MRIGETFSFSPERGFTSLIKGKQVFVTTTEGAVFSVDAMQPMDFLTPYLRTLLGFLGIQVAALGEMLCFIENCVIDRRFAADLFGKLPVTSLAAKGAAVAIASGNYAPLFPVALVHKDFTYAVASAQSHNAAVPATAFVRELFAQAVSSGYGGENIQAIAKIFNKQDIS